MHIFKGFACILYVPLFHVLFSVALFVPFFGEKKKRLPLLAVSGACGKFIFALALLNSQGKRSPASGHATDNYKLPKSLGRSSCVKELNFNSRKPVCTMLAKMANKTILAPPPSHLTV